MPAHHKLAQGQEAVVRLRIEAGGSMIAT